MRSYGVEADAIGVPLPDWIISVSMGFNIAEYKFFPDAENTVSNILEICEGNMLLGCTDFTQDLSGERINGAPEWSISAVSQYERLLPIPGVSILWRIQAEYSYTSPVNLAMDLDPQLEQDAVNLLNLRAGLRAEDDLWSVMFEVTNVTDAKWQVFGFDVPIVGGFAGINGPPRQYGVRFRLKY
jgi:outer membrane receptor protein involved in Fe transport